MSRKGASVAEARIATRERWMPLAIGLVAFVVRAMFLFATGDRVWPYSALYEGDAPAWVEWARALDRGESYEFGLPMRTPGVAYLLHWLVPGELAAQFVELKLLWCAISAATCAWLYVVVRRELSRRAALIAAGLLCFSFGSYQTATSLNNEALYTFLVVGIVDLTQRSLERASSKTFALLGALHGLALLLRAEHTLLLAILLAYSAWRLRAQSVRVIASSAAIVALCALLVCAPWSWRNHRAIHGYNTFAPKDPDLSRANPPWSAEARDYFRRLPAFAHGGNFEFLQALSQQAGLREMTRADVEKFFTEQFGYTPEPMSEWVLVSSKGPLDFALANDLRSDGGFSRAGLLDGHDEKPQFAFGRPSHLKLYNRGYEVGLATIRANCGAWLALVGKKLVRFHDGATLGWTAYDLPFGRASVRRAVDLATPRDPSRIAQGVIASVIIAGAILALRRRAATTWLLVVAYKLAITVAFYGYARQAVSIAPAFYVLAALAIEAVSVRLPRASWIGWSLVGVALVCDVIHVATAREFAVEPARPDVPVMPAPRWAPDAFEAFGDVVLTPRSS